MKFPLAKQCVEVYDTRRPRGYAGMGSLAVVAVILAGFFAGTVNAVVGSSSLITFPVLLALGFPPVVANVSNTVGLSVGNVGAVIGYRRELRGQLRRLLWLSAPAIAGAALGAALLLFLPDLVFRAVVPALIIFAIALVIVQPWLSKRFREHGPSRWAGAILPVAVFLTAVYGGYFGASQGVILISILAVVLTDPLQHLNALKNAVIMLVQRDGGNPLPVHRPRLLEARAASRRLQHRGWPGRSLGRAASLARGASSFHRVGWFGRGDQAAPLKRFGPP
jgi:uncharacterized protein